ncbi:MAG: AraC family transcriptional regulator [Bacteroidales bacterium]|jgi:AraC-like DNA-binding protein|nr:AraC family transcriptional regulator [Bacteroidales bacterium]
MNLNTVSVQKLMWKEDILPKLQGKREACNGNFCMFEHVPIENKVLFPSQLDVSIIMLCTEGQLTGFYNLQEINLHASSLAFFLPRQILEIRYMSENFKGLFMSISEYLGGFIFGDLPDILSRNVYIKNYPDISLSSENFAIIERHCRLLWDILLQQQNVYVPAIVKNMVQSFVQLAGSFVHHCNLDTNKFTLSRDVLRRFLVLLGEHCKEHADIDFYAQKMKVDKKYLTKIVKTYSSKTITQWIDYYRLRRMQYFLTKTDETISDISNMFCFATLSCFTRSFVRMTGISPTEYRKKYGR